MFHRNTNYVYDDDNGRLDTTNERHSDIRWRKCVKSSTKNLSTANQIWNIYGPTETTIYCLSKKLKLGEEITLGKPLPGTKVWVQTKKKNERTGELYVVGPSVGFGYINNIELTKSIFY